MEENNIAHLSGKIVSEFEFNHVCHGKNYYEAKLEIIRLSGTKDILPIIIPECMLDEERKYEGSYCEIDGEFHSYNKWDNENKNGKKSHLILFICVQKLTIIEGFEEDGEEVLAINDIHLKGYLCKDSVYRTTPSGKEVADCLLAVNRENGKSDYIPLLLWGRNARKRLRTGDQIEIWGRMQSREYNKVYADGSCKVKTAYELSVYKIQQIYVEEYPLEQVN